MRKRKFAEGGVFREGMQVPQDIDGASAPKKKSMPMRKPTSPKTPDQDFVPAYGDDANYSRKKDKERAEMSQRARQIGREEGAARQQKASTRGGVLGTPMAYMERAGQYIGDKFDDADAYLSEKVGMKDRAAFTKGVRQGLKDEGYAKGGSVGSASKRADGCATKGKTKGTMITMMGGGKC